MARLSKSHHFQIFEDTGIPTPPGDENDPFDDEPSLPRASTLKRPSKQDCHESANASHSEGDADDEPLPRDSLTSVSTFPDSSSQRNEAEYTVPPASPQKFFTPPIIRPSFRRPESVRRMQMSSPRQSILSYYRSSRSGTPPLEHEKGSARGRRRITEESTSEDEERRKDGEGGEHPLVLLHVTLLPSAMPWSMESMQEILPPQVMEKLLLLRSKVSETVAQRGILIPHPREEYEMLEERLLEALELQNERLTKCGHFRGRVSDSLRLSSDVDSDSGLGSSASSSDDGEICATCLHHVRCVASKKQKWSVEVFAANGLMRSAAWAAAWSEMESVDVEILPWIDEEDRKKLDRRRDEEEEERWRREEEEDRVREAMSRAMVLAPQSEEPLDRGSKLTGFEPPLESGHDTYTDPALDRKQAQPGPLTEIEVSHDLPPIYPRSQVPLSVLLRNYIFLLAQDRRSVALLFLGILAVFFALRSTAPAGVDLAVKPIEYTSPQEATMAVANDRPKGEVIGMQREQDVPSVLESVVETISEALRDEEAVFEELEGHVATTVPPQDTESSDEVEQGVLDEETPEMIE